MDLRRTTFLRFVAAFAVVVFHFGRDCRSLAWGESLWAVANSATSFFFVLSGFILACVYGQRPGWTHAGFYSSRLARIVPLYALATMPAATWFLCHGGIGWPDYALVGLLLQAWVPGHARSVANPPGWSLSVEAFFYLLFPFVLAALARLRSAKALIAAMAAVWAGNLWLHWRLLQPFAAGGGSPWLWDAVHHHPLGHLGTFVVGVLGGLVYLRHGERVRRAGPWLALGAAAVLAAFALSRSPVLAYHHNGMFAPLFYLVILGVAAGEARVLGLLACRPLQLLGEISYGVYILQVPADFGCRAAAAALGWPTTGDAFFWPFTALLVLASWLAYRFVESPARAWINGLYRRRAAAALAADPGPLAR